MGEVVSFRLQATNYIGFSKITGIFEIFVILENIDHYKK